MNSEAMKEALNELFSHLERLETQSEAILQFLKEKKRVTDKQLAPYMEQASNASNVKWRAARVRIEHLLEPEHPEKEIKLGKTPEPHDEPSRAGSSESAERNKEQPAQAKPEQQSDAEVVHHPTDATAELAEKEDAEPAAQLNSKQLNSKEKKNDQEAA